MAPPAMPPPGTSIGAGWLLPDTDPHPVAAANTPMAKETARALFRISPLSTHQRQKRRTPVPSPSKKRGEGQGEGRYGTVTEKSVTASPTPPLQISNPAKTLVRYQLLWT